MAGIDSRVQPADASLFVSTPKANEFSRQRTILPSKKFWCLFLQTLDLKANSSSLHEFSKAIVYHRKYLDESAFRPAQTGGPQRAEKGRDGSYLVQLTAGIAYPLSLAWVRRVKRSSPVTTPGGTRSLRSVIVTAKGREGRVRFVLFQVMAKRKKTIRALGRKKTDKYKSTANLPESRKVWYCAVFDAPVRPPPIKRSHVVSTNQCPTLTTTARHDVFAGKSRRREVCAPHVLI